MSTAFNSMILAVTLYVLSFDPAMGGDAYDGYYLGKKGLEASFAPIGKPIGPAGGKKGDGYDFYDAPGGKKGDGYDFYDNKPVAAPFSPVAAPFSPVAAPDGKPVAPVGKKGDFYDGPAGKKGDDYAGKPVASQSPVGKPVAGKKSGKKGDAYDGDAYDGDAYDDEGTSAPAVGGKPVGKKFGKKAAGNGKGAGKKDLEMKKKKPEESQVMEKIVYP